MLQRQRRDKVGVFKFVAIVVMLLAGAACSTSETGVHVIDTAQPFDRYLLRLTSAIGENGLTITSGACGKCGIKTIDVSDENALILTVSRPGLMLEMLQASAPAGADPPLRFYLSKLPDGSARLTYHRPSFALAVYDLAALRGIGLELDAVFAHIVRDASRR